MTSEKWTSIPKAKPGRYYCPVCGTVQFGYRHWLDGWAVQPHNLHTDAWTWDICPGGKIDPKTDKAP